MRRRALIMLAAALVLGGFAVFLTQVWVKSQSPSTTATVEDVSLTEVVVARTSLGFGNKLRRDQVRLANWPKDSLPSGSFHSIDELLGGGEDRVVLRMIEPNEPILKNKVSGFGERAAMSSKLSKSMRGVSIRVNDVLGVGGFVLPGDRVDVLLTRDAGRKGQRRPVTDIMLQNVRVLGIDQEAAENQDKPRVVRAVTLEVTARQAQKLTLAAQVGTLSLALRNYSNFEETKHRRITLADLRAGETASKPRASRKSGRRVRSTRRNTTVTVIRGVKASSKQVIVDRGRSKAVPRQRSVGSPENLMPK